MAATATEGVEVERPPRRSRSTIPPTSPTGSCRSCPCAARFRTFDENLARMRVLLAHGRDEHADLAPAPRAAGGPPLLLGTWGAEVERAAREFDGWLASS